MNENDAGKWSEHALSSLTEAGYRTGSARAAVIDSLAAQHCALTAPDIEQVVRTSTKQKVSRATVYRVLEELDGLGLVTRVELGDGQARFEPALPSGHHHHHMICGSCDAVIPFEDKALERALHRASEASQFEMDEHEVLIRGLCAKCAAGAAAV